MGKKREKSSLDINFYKLSKNGGGTATTAENRHLPSNLFLPFLAELDISESFETNFFSQKNSLVFVFQKFSKSYFCHLLELSSSARNAKKIFFFVDGGFRRTKPNNHGLHESGKTPPPPLIKLLL